MSTKQKFEASLATFDISGGVLIALSGGADSVCLLDLFVSAKNEGRFPYPIEAAHLNHRLRGKESERDAEFCKELCKRLCVPLTTRDADITAIAKESGKTLEEAAREVRYAFLSDTLAKNGSLSHVVTAHHRGDVCETVILNLARGASLDGLCGVPKQRGSIIRPLLSVSRKEILDYVSKKGLTFVTDSTNADVKYSRNRVRHNILPELEKLYTGYEENVERTVKLLRRDADFLSEMADNLYSEVVKDGVLYTKKAQNLHPSMLTRIIKKLYNYHGYRDMSEAHIDAVCGKIYSGDENFSLSLHSCTALCSRGALSFCKDAQAADFSFPTALENSVTLDCGITVTLTKERCEGAYPLKKSALCGELAIRSRREGDTVKFFGKTHKIKRIISDKKLSPKEKSKLFFLTNDGEIIYSNLGVTADSAFVRRGETDCIFITVKDID